MREEFVQAARDALDAQGGPVQYTAGDYTAEITAVIRPGVEIFDEAGQVATVTTLRGISSDMPGLRTGATFLDQESGQLYEYLKTLRHDSITRLISIGKTSAQV